MTGFILGTKEDHSQTFSEDGIRIPTTFILTSPCYITEIKTKERDGYNAVQLGFGTCNKIQKPVKGILDKAGIKTPLHFLREFTLTESVKILVENKKKILQIGDLKLEIGHEIKPTTFFKIGDKVTISGYAKGKGFQGVVKRHHFKGGSRTHGQSDRERAPGSIGMTTTPGRVFKGKRMAGRMGNQRVTIKNYKIIEISDTGFTVKGLVPGAKRQLIEISSA
ncbi:50S ribosomal protein L3 [Candidatus Roizmanbacteria bacterium CG_4_10_14_0_8_um_filter_33_9]|uniref:50S ribosomal protein L3 n=1 Tax=Candidatus Roizmanbacteria bacterium CG_4_10_14_0_8_um_filter_33_9 TaxID=1974826 RepID=A0A2M7QHR2_9BACT|nr:MAG: 50S ribosomal protein L3 [Candidatus Roizmanbacteria bacterium CG_4_10_14_0_8_um_filter_33_9]